MKRRRFIVGLGGIAAAGAFVRAGCGGPHDRPAALGLAGAASPSQVDAALGGDVWVTLRVLAPDCGEEDRPPVNLGLVVDTSGSMAGEAIAAAKSAATELIGTLRDGDRVSIVAFHSFAEVVCKSIDIDDVDRDDLEAAIESMQARGTTDLGAGLAASYADIAPYAGPDMTTRIVLLSDGVPNAAEPAVRAAAQAAAASITVTAFGLGLDYDETLLASIARQTGGNFHYVQSASELAEAFGAENRRLQDVVTRNVRLDLTAGPKVTIAELVGSSLGPGKQAAISLGDFSRGEERVVVARLSVGPHGAGAPIELLDAMVVGEDPATGAQLPVQRCFVEAEASDDPSAIAAAIVVEVEREVERARASAATLDAVAAAREGDTFRAVQILDDALTPKLIPPSASPETLDQAQSMGGLRDRLSAAADEQASELDDETRHAVRTAHGSAMKNLQNRASGS